MTKIGFVYLLRNLVNGKGYVGQHAGKSTDKRWGWHIWAAYKGLVKSPLYAAMRKYGLDNFSAEIIWQGDTDLLNDRETFYIANLNTFIDDSHGYNLTRGGGCNRGWVPSAITRARMSAAQKAAYAADPTPWLISAAKQRGIVRTAEQRLRTKVSTKLAHEKDPELRWRIAAKNRGYKHTNAAKEKIGAFNKGRKRSPEHCMAIAAAKLGKKRGPLTPEWRANISAGHKGTPSKYKGVKHGPRPKDCGNRWDAKREQELDETICRVCGVA
jgi:group I intron endonuclease